MTCCFWRAAFVCASATGAALGPLLALLLAKVPSTKVGPLTFDRITLAAWLMVAFWLVFILGWLALFKDPLEECGSPLPPNNSPCMLGAALMSSVMQHVLV